MKVIRALLVRVADNTARPLPASRNIIALALAGQGGTAMFVGLLHLYFLLTRPLTIGVRAAIRVEDGKFMLARHTYTPGWHFPGGGLEKNENARDALCREVEQEVGIQLRAEPTLFGVYFNRGVSKRDHVLLFECAYGGDLPAKSPSCEIAEISAFDPDGLPEDVDPGTAQRIREIVQRASVRPEW